MSTKSKLSKVMGDFDWGMFTMVCVIGLLIIFGITALILLGTLMFSFAIWKLVIILLIAIMIILIIAVAYGLGIFY